MSSRAWTARQGSSIMNMMAGDAEKSLFTMANLWGGSEDDKRRRAEDVALLMLNPYFLARGLVVFVRESARELWEALRQQVRNVQPRLNRLEHWYPFVRAATCGLMRDISANIAILDILRGAPSIYMLYLGYDEVAHHSGPWRRDAFGDPKRHLHGRRAAVIPVIVVLLYILGFVLVFSLFAGVDLTWDTLFQAAGLTPR